MLSAKNLKKSYGSNPILDDAEINLNKGMRAGLVGVNGAGKSTLMRILAGEEEVEGTIKYIRKIPLIGYMKQEIVLESYNITLLDFMKQYTGFLKIESEVFELMGKLDEPGNMDEYTEKYDLFERMGGYEFESNAEKTLAQIGLKKFDMYSTTISKLSGGEKNKLLLSSTLLKGGDLLFLDEPTNNLDRNSIDGLIAILKESLAVSLIVSHDKKFLNEVSNKIFEITDGKINEFTGNYDFYKEQKSIQYNNQLAAHQRQQEEFDRMNESKRSLENKAHSIASRGNFRDNDKGDGASKVAKKLAKQAKTIKNRVERTEEVEKPKLRKPLNLILELNDLPEGNITISNLKFNYNNDNTFELNINDINFSSKDKILIKGENGQGKSTLLKIITGQLKQSSGEIKISPSINIGYFAQEQNQLPPEKSSIEFIENMGLYTNEDINYVLAQMGFEKDDRDKKIKFLSPGMRSRLIFSLMSLRKNNALIFDEPTNHVDVETVKQLEEAVNSFNGMVIIVSHDDDFINNINFTKEVQIHNGYAKTRIL